MTEVPRGYLSLAHAAIYTDTPVGTLRDKVRRNELKAYKPAKQVMFKIRELDEWMARHKLLTVTP